MSIPKWHLLGSSIVMDPYISQEHAGLQSQQEEGLNLLRLRRLRGIGKNDFYWPLFQKPI